ATAHHRRQPRPLPSGKDSTLSKVALALVIHSHQPVGNFDHVIEEAYQKSYHPFLEALSGHPRIKMTLHYSGILLEWMEAHHPEFFDLLRGLAEPGQIELLGGGHFEPILIAIPDAEKVAQIERQARYLRERFGASPHGIWVAERVWEQSLIQPLVQAGVRYTILDDTHFIAAGLEPDQLQGAYITEDAGAPLHLFPSLQSLRYTIPFRDPQETLDILRKGKPGALFAVGDDCEKFGVWPGTYEHCYTHGWLERFLKAVEEAGDWLDTVTLGDHFATRKPQGRIYLPTASYAEMMAWALPLPACRQLAACLSEVENSALGKRVQRFMRGGLWLNFLCKYAESNQLHKLVMRAGERWHAARLATVAGTETHRLLELAQTHLLAAQCNDAYWHGVFGGLYAPHLRSGLLGNLIQAEILLDRAESLAGDSGMAEQVADFDLDGQPELCVENPVFGMVARPADGATLSSLRFKPARVELINSLMRRPEAYHDLVRQHFTSKQAPREGPASIHDHVWSKEANLGALLRYDNYARHAFRTYLFPASKTFQDFSEQSLEENQWLAGGAWQLQEPLDGTGEWEFRSATSLRPEHADTAIEAAKRFQVRARGDRWDIECLSTFSSQAQSKTAPPMAFGLELVVNLLAPNAPDRYFEAGKVRHPLEFKGEIDSRALTIVDEWQRLRIHLKGDPAVRWWIAPIETISQSESGFERVYQGSAVMAVWNVDLPGGTSPEYRLQAEITHLGARGG
ncbi:MAG: alpha-amylase/4-alpha-glucanotransferase domain-containing protein, partial [Terriglobia bacterium]